MPLPLQLGRACDCHRHGPSAAHRFEVEITPPAFDCDFLEQLGAPDLDAAWEAVVEVGREEIVAAAGAIFGKGVAVEFAGRSGGWAIVSTYDEDEVAEWDGSMVAKWGRFARFCRAIAGDAPRRIVEALYFTVFQRVWRLGADPVEGPVEGSYWPESPERSESGLGSFPHPT